MLYFSCHQQDDYDKSVSSYSQGTSQYFEGQYSNRIELEAV